LWVDLAGGSSYTKYKEAQLDADTGDGLVGFGYNPMQHAVAGVEFLSTTNAQHSVATYQLWLRHKYSGKRTQMSENSYSSSGGTTYAPPTPTLVASEPILEHTDNITDQFGNVNSYTLFSATWTNGSATNEEISYFVLETQYSASPGATRHDTYRLYSPDATTMSWSDDQPATFPDDFVWPATHDQARVVAVGVYGHESASGWRAGTSSSTPSSQSGAHDDVATDYENHHIGLRIDTDSDTKTRRFINVLDDYSNAQTGALAIRPFGASAPSVNTMFRCTLRGYTHLPDDGAFEILFSAYWASTNWTTGAGWLSEQTKGNDTDFTKRIRTCKDASGNPVFLIGDTADVSNHTHWYLDMEVMYSGASTYDPSDATYEIVTSLTSWTTVGDHNPIRNRFTTRAGEIAALTGVVPTDWDTLLINDTTDSNNVKKVNFDNIGAFVHGDGAQISRLTSKATPVSADLIMIEDSAASNAKKQITVGSLPGASELPRTTAVTEDTGSTVVAASTWTSSLSVSSGPYVLSLVQNTDTTSCKFRISADGTSVWTSPSYLTTNQVDTGPGSALNVAPIFCRTSLLIEVFAASATTLDHTYVYHTMSYS
jgi:hypothetical protein